MKFPFLSLFRSALTTPAPGNQPSPPDPSVPKDLIDAFENDFVLTEVEWEQKYRQVFNGGFPALNGMIKYVADRPWLAMAPSILGRFFLLKGQPGIDQESLNRMLERYENMPNVLLKLVGTVKGEDTYVSWPEYEQLLNDIFGPGGFSALTVFLHYLSQTGKGVDIKITERLQALAQIGWVSKKVLAGIKAVETTVAEGWGNVERLLTEAKQAEEFQDIDRAATKYDQALAILKELHNRTKGKEKEIAKKLAFFYAGRWYAAQQNYGRAIEQYKNFLKAEPKSAEGHFYLAEALYRSGSIEGNEKGKKKLEEAKEGYRKAIKLADKTRDAQMIATAESRIQDVDRGTTTFDMSKLEERPVELPTPMPKPPPPAKEAPFTIIKVEVDDESFRQNQMRAESKSLQSAGEELLRKSQGRIKVVFERALKKVPSWNITKVDMTLTVNSQGRVTRIKFVPNLDNAPGGFVDGLRDITKYWLFPAGGEVKFPLIFHASGG